MPVIRARRRTWAGVATGSRGNAQLEPLESDNYDLSLEWYYGEGSAFTVAFFDKSVKNFIGNEQVTTNLFGLRDVTNGAPGTRLGQAIDALSAHTKARWYFSWADRDEPLHHDRPHR